MKLALLIGINYRGTSSQLNGCINDVLAMKKYLLTQGYTEDHITVMTEDQSGEFFPTKDNIVKQIKQLLLEAHHQKATHLWFHYSGHGTYTLDRSGDELDGRDEMICPLDFQKNGCLSDDQLHFHFQRLPEKCHCFCLFDCCHSGTILDLRYRYRGSQEIVENSQSTLDRDLVMISGCRDDQTSADAYIQGKWSGAMTASFLACVHSDHTYGQLIEEMRTYLKKNHYTQVPQICSCHSIKMEDPLNFLS